MGYFTLRGEGSTLLKDASVLIAGTIAAQAISILLQPLLRRCFTPSDFGIFSLYLSFVGILLVFTTLRYDDAIVLPKTDKESVNVLALSFFLNLSLSILLAVAFAIWGDYVISFFNLEGKLSHYALCLVPLGVFLYNSYQCLNYWLIRKKRYKNVACSKIVRRTSEGIVQTSFAFFKNGNGLVIGDVVGQIANTIYALVRSVSNGLRFNYISKNKLLYVLKKYSEFPKYNLFPSIMSAVSFMLPPIIISKFYSAEYTGYFDLSKLLLSLPMAFIATSVSNVILQRVAEKYSLKLSFYRELVGIFAIIAIICFFEIILIQLFGKELFCLFFGDDWEISGRIAMVMVWPFALNFITSSFSSIFVALRRIKLYSIWQMVYFLSIVSLLFFAKNDFFDFLNIYVLIEIVCYLFVLLMLSVVVYRYEFNIRHLKKVS